MTSRGFRIVVLTALTFATDVSGQYSFTDFQPRYGSYNGATRIRIFGVFNINPFNSGVGERVPETKVILASDFQEYECDVEKDSTHETQIACYTRPMPVGNYRVCPEVAGIQMNCRWWFYVRDYRTPFIQSLYFSNFNEYAFAGPPRSLITVEGRLYTDIYGPNDVQFLVTGNELSIRRAYAGPEDCSLIVEGTSDDLYGLEFNPNSNSYGRFTCKMKSEFVGNSNFSFIVTEYGRSSQDLSLMHVTGDDKIYMFQTFAEITDVSPQSGSRMGGTTVTISGEYFDPHPSVPTKIFVGRQPCIVVPGSLTENEVKCITPEEPEPSLTFPGSRGVIVEMWEGESSNDLETARITLNSSYSGYSTWHQDSAGYSFTEVYTTIKMTGLFEAPKDDRYQFYVRSDDKSLVYVSCDGNPANAVKVAEAPSYTPYWHSRVEQHSEFMELKKGQICYYDAIAVNWAGPGNLYVGVLHATTTLTQAQSRNVLDERQYLRWTNYVKNDIQILEFMNWTADASVYEVQEIVVENLCSSLPSCWDTQYSLRFRGATTSFISHDVSDFDFIAALHEVIPGDTQFSVAAATVDGAMVYTVTFETDMGDEPMLEVAGKGDNITVSIQEITKGYPDFQHFALEIMGRTTSNIPFNAPASDVEDALMEISGAKCPQELLGKDPFYLTMLDFEGPVPNGYVESGNRVSNMEAYCGRQSIRAPYNVFSADREHFQKYRADDYPVVCFAVIGAVISRIRVQYEFTSSSDNKIRTYYQYYFENEVPVGDEWSYKCYNLKDAIEAHVPEATDIVIVRVGGFSRANNFEDFYIDAFMIASKTFDTPDILEKRVPPAMHQGKTAKFEVEKENEDLARYDITIKPNDCAHNLPLISVRNAREIVSSGSDNAETRALNWPNGTIVNVTRTERTNLPMGGTFDLSYEDDELGVITLPDIPSGITRQELEALLESVEGFGDIKVSDNGDLCYRSRFVINWISNGGDKNPLQVNVSKVTGDEELQFRFIELTDGGALHGPIPGDMGRMMFDSPQVEVVMNGIQSSCNGDCSFTYSEDSTPDVISVNPTEGTGSTTIVISGTNLDETDVGSEVLIDGVVCQISSQTETTVTCSTGNMKFGVHKVKVRIGGKGYARHPDPMVNYTQKIQVTDFVPTQSFQTGGLWFTVNGFGFSDEVAVKIGGKDCPIQHVTVNQIQCIVPPSDTLSSVPVTLETSLETVNAGSFLYSNAGMPIVSGINPANIDGPGGDTLQIDGSGFGNTIEDVIVTVGGVSCNLTHVTDTMIMCDTPYFASGSYLLKIVLSGLGAADFEVNGISDQITYSFAVTDIQPRSVSLLGGSDVTLTGIGFVDGTSVTFGGIECAEKHLSSTSITCTTGSTAREHVIENTGVHSVQGLGYAWEPAVVTVRKGDTVTWKWILEVQSSPLLGIQVFETDEPGATEPSGGFISGPRSFFGTFSHTFDDVGTTYFSTGFVDYESFGQVVMHGAVNVLPLSDLSLGVDVSSNGVMAEIDLTTSEIVKRQVEECEPLNADIEDCGQSRRKRSLSRRKRTLGEIIAITDQYKNDFLDEHNQARSGVVPSGSNIVLARWDDGLAGSAETYAQECTWGHSTGRSHPSFSSVGENLAIYTRGWDVNALATAAVTQWVNEVQDYTYSNNSCSAVCGHYTQVVWHDSYAIGCGMADCDQDDLENDPFADPAHDGAYIIVCQYGESGNFLGESPYAEGDACSACPADFPSCDDSYSLCVEEAEEPTTPEGITGSVCRTPTVTSISPRYGTSNDDITIEGHGFGDLSCRLEVNIGSDITCTITSNSATTIVCKPTPDEGASIGVPYEVTVNVLGYGNALIDITSDAERRFALIPLISDVQPTGGSTAGGTVISLTGSGMMENLTEILIGGQLCEIVEHGYFSTTCMTPPGNVGTQQVIVLVNAVSAECLNTCEFTYDLSLTPDVTSFAPDEVQAADTQIQINGTNLDGTVQIFIGSSPCDIVTGTASQIICTVAELTAGDHQISLHVAGKGYATLPSPSTIGGVALAEISPAAGSVAGGTVCSLTGHGFNCEEFSVMIGSNEATILSRTNALVEIMTPSGSAGNQQVAISCDGVNYPSLQYNYDVTLTPTLSSVLPTSGTPGTVITIAGLLLEASAATTNSILVGDAECVISAESATEITCETSEPSSGGVKDVVAMIGGVGYAASNGVTFTFTSEISSFTPTEGSYGGGNEIIISGSGFSSDAVVRVGESKCNVTTSAYDSITCAIEPTPSIDTRQDPVISSEVQVDGTDVTVFGAVPYDGHFQIGQAAAGCADCSDSLPHLLTVTSGDENALVSPVSFTQLLNDGSGTSLWEPVAPSASHVCLGNFLMDGSLSPDASDVVCVHYMLVEDSTPTLLLNAGPYYIWSVADSPFVTFTPTSTPPTVFKMRDMSAALPDLAVTVSVQNDENNILTSASTYTFLSSLTPVVTSVTPPRGGTGGGTDLTIAGNGFSSTSSDVTVTIDGSPCIVSSSSLTSIQCTTESHPGSVRTAVIVTVAGKGTSLGVGAKFFYVDVWSSPWTWGGRGVPGAGTLVVIPANQEIMIDVDTEVLEMLLIQGGRVFFDQKDIELNAKNILIEDGGKFEIGTEDEPFQHKAIVTLHGHLRSIELPIYGTKTIGVRNGTLDLHGKHVPVTWTYLRATAEEGASTIVVDNPVTWQAGDEIVIASTGDRHSQKENEKHVILSVAADQLTITLNGSLAYRHLGEEELLPDGTILHTRAEVGLLTRNVVVRGSRNMDWSEIISACPEGFNTGEFATQTCFQGRFGEEMGSDQFGGQIMFHHPSQDEQNAFGRISYVELTYMGQAFRLGRYAIHFHLMGDMNYKNYVRGCAIHETFNRAVTIHDTHKALVENNVVYNAMGGAVFIEDGIETGNILRGNLVVFCRQSTSLQNEDITPAAFWITNPDNVVEDNAAAGGTHFGFWYRMNQFPSGPSHTKSICPRNVALGSFRNNTCHSQGWFGLWIFQEFTPKEGSGCGGTVNKIAPFYNLRVWNCDKGAEFVQTSSVEIRDSLFFNNRFAGMEVKMMKPPFVWGETGIFNSVIVGHSAVSESDEQMGSGVVLPFTDGWMTEDVTFINFDRPGGAVFSTAKIDGTCADHCGGFHSRFRGITYHNCPNLGKFRWEHENIIEDMDGSLTNSASARVVIASTDTAPPTCTEETEWSVGAHPGMVCPEMRLHRIAWYKALPTSLEGSLVNLTNQYGRTQVPFEKKRMTHAPGWMALLFDGEAYDWTYHHLPKMANVTYEAAYYNYRPGECNIMRHTFTQSPDHFNVAPDQDNNSTDAPLSCAANYYGDYYFDELAKTMEYIVTGEPARRKRGIRFADTWADPNARNRVVKMNTYRCYYKDCIPPPDPNTVPPPRERPEEFDLWSSTAAWDSGVLPADNEDVFIPSGRWIVADIDFPIINELWIEGALEVDWEPQGDGSYKTFTLTVHNVFIRGGSFIIGWEDNLFRGIMNIILTGDRDSSEFPIVQGVNMGAKAIGVFGGLDMHGITTTTSWTRLGQTANAGSNQIVLQEAVDWQAGDEIVITTTSFDAWETETFEISSVAGQTITLNGSLLYDHIASNYAHGGVTYDIAAEVGLLTRNIKVIGEEYPGSDEESFGGRIIVGQYMQEGVEYRGYARIEDVQFVRMGQEGYSDASDPRYALVYWKTGTQDLIKPSYVRRCSFFRNFNTAIGAFLANEITFSNNVVHHTVGSSIRLEGSGNRLENNLVSLMINPGTYNGKTNFMWTWFGAIQTNGASSVYLGGNVVAGSERAAYWIGGEPCDDLTWGTNVARASLDGIYVNKYGQGDCTALNGFRIHHSYDFGIYYQDASSVEIQNSIITDSGVGILTLFNGPSSTTHVYEAKFSKITGVTLVAVTENGVCPVLDTSRGYIASSPNGRAPRNGEMETFGILGPSFMSGHNKAPTKSFAGLMQYPALGGEMELQNVGFVNYGDTTCPGVTHVAFSPSTKNEDYQHPVYMSQITLENTPLANRIFYPRPSKGLIDPSNCVDMECDALKNMLVTDRDGTFLGSPGTIIPEAEFEWNGDPVRGLEDARIPKTLLTRPNGSRIPYDEIAPNKGIYRSNSCVMRSEWQAYECHDDQYQLLVIESLDADSETRRLSPVALLTDGYIDLENGPQDHGWCAGYTCQLRLSTFYTTVAVDKTYEIHFTGSSPQQLRLRLPHAEDDEAIVACLFYSTSNRLDVYVDDSYVLPKNGYYSGAKVLTKRPPDDDSDLYTPNITDPTGSNFYDRAIHTICITLRGSKPVDIKISNAIFLNFELPSVTEDEFFDNLITNLAALLQVPEEDIWIVNVVAEGSSRKRRQTEAMNVQIAVGAPPAQTSPITPKVINRANATEDGTIIDPGEPDPATEAANAAEEENRDQLQRLAAVVKNSVETGSLSAELNTTVIDTGIVGPLPPSSDEDWEQTAKDLEEGNITTITMTEAGSLVIMIQPGENNGRASDLLDLQPKLRILDTTGSPMLPGLEIDPWIVSVTLLENDESANFIGTTQAPVVDGVAEFTDLSVDLQGDYQLLFEVTYPESAELSVFSNIFNLRKPLVKKGCTDVEGHATFDREYFWENDDCSRLCTFDCDGDDEQCADMDCCGLHAECIDEECVCDEDFDYDVDDPDNADDVLDPVVICGPGSIELRINKCGANAIGFNLATFSVWGDGSKEDRAGDPSTWDGCTGRVLATEEGVVYSFMIVEDFTQCNADIVENATHIQYNNVLRGFKTEEGELIVRDRPVQVDFSCAYQRSVWKTMENAVHPFISTVQVQLQSEGQYDIAMGMFTDLDYLVPAEEPVNVHVPDKIYIAVVVEGNTDVTLFLEECKAASSNDAEPAMEYGLIMNGCPTGGDVHLADKELSNEAKFSFNSFEFKTSSSELYVQCDVKLCETDTAPCTSNCGGVARKRRNANTNKITLGPIEVDEKISAAEGRKKRGVPSYSAITNQHNQVGIGKVVVRRSAEATNMD